jgi:hypothetical protein
MREDGCGRPAREGRLFDKMAEYKYNKPDRL